MYSASLNFYSSSIPVLPLFTVLVSAAVNANITDGDCRIVLRSASLLNAKITTHCVLSIHTKMLQRFTYTTYLGLSQ